MYRLQYMWINCVIRQYIVNVSEKDYADGYLKGDYRKTLITWLFNWTMRTFHMGFMLHVEFKK